MPRLSRLFYALTTLTALVGILIGGRFIISNYGNGLDLAVGYVIILLSVIVLILTHLAHGLLRGTYPAPSSRPPPPQKQEQILAPEANLKGTPWEKEPSHTQSGPC